MYLRVTRRRNRDGSVVEYYQLAETHWDPAKRRPTAQIIHNFGRADALDREALVRLARSISRVCHGGIEVPGEVAAPGEAIEIEWARPLGVVHVARALWEALGIGPVLRGRERRRGRRAPHELALFTMVANRLAEPLSKLACHAHWVPERVYLPEAEGLTLEQLYFALDFLDTHIEAVEREVFFRTADLFRADVDLIFWDTTSVYFEVDDEDEAPETRRGKTLPPLRKRGHAKGRRDGDPQVVVGLALTRDGLPVRSWVFPGNTVDATTVAQVKESLRGWKLGRAVFVGDAGMDSEANRHALAKGLGHYILAMPMGKLTEVQTEVLARPGRFRRVHASLEVKEVVVGAGERRRRYLVCRNLQEAERQRQHREALLAELRAELARLDPAAPELTKRACELVASQRYGRYLSRGPGSRLALDAAAVRRAERMDGKYVLLTNDDTLTPEDVGLGYKAMMIIEACFRRMKTTGLRIRPVYHWTAHRITSHIKLCVLALLLERAAEIRAEDTWRNLRLALEEIKAVRCQVQGTTVVQTTRLTAQATAYLKKLGIAPPKRILSLERHRPPPAAA
ncbi:MAG TPA: IS1634 family transposase [Thermoanaerobaculaceae bacterium]|nr:IS1634 family transposase [Thermoanaerobaculaceae bacterium]